jgi:hypothetical protein
MIQKKKTIRDIGHEEDIVEWSNERCEEIEWTTTTRPSKAMGRDQRNNFNMEDAYDLR